jgi:hypothetical protein
MKALVKSDSKGIQKRHIRKYPSGKVTVVNRDIIKKPVMVPFKAVPRVEPALEAPPQMIKLPPRPEHPKIDLSQMEVPKDATSMAIMFYVADHENVFGEWPMNKVQQLAKEASEISQFAPLFYPKKEYKGGEFQRMWHHIEKKMELISVNSDNEFTIQGSPKIYSPLQIAALLYWTVNKLSGGQVEEKQDFRWMKMSKFFSKIKGGPNVK